MTLLALLLAAGALVVGSPAGRAVAQPAGTVWSFPAPAPGDWGDNLIASLESMLDDIMDEIGAIRLSDGRTYELPGAPEQPLPAELGGELLVTVELRDGTVVLTPVGGSRAVVDIAESVWMDESASYVGQTLRVTFAAGTGLLALVEPHPLGTQVTVLAVEADDVDAAGTGQLPGRWVHLVEGGPDNPRELQQALYVAGAPALGTPESSGDVPQDPPDEPFQPDDASTSVDGDPAPDADAGAPPDGFGSAGGSIRDVQALETGVGQTRGIDPVTASAVGAALAAGLVGLVNLLLPGLQAAGGVPSVAGAPAPAAPVPAAPTAPNPPTPAPAAAWVEPAVGERMVYSDGREYVWHLPVDEIAEGPFWVPVEHVEEEQRLLDEGRVFVDGRWHADAQAARDERARRERWEREAAEGSILSRGLEQLDRPDHDVVVPPPTAPPPPPPAGWVPGTPPDPGPEPAVDHSSSTGSDELPEPPDQPLSERELAGDEERRPRPEEDLDAGLDVDLDAGVEVEGEPGPAVEMPEGLDAGQRERYVAYVTGQRGDLAGIELTDQQRELADAARDAAIAAQTGAINDRFADLIEQRHREGYYVRNPDLPRKGWNQTIGRVDDAASRQLAQRQHDAIDRVRNDAELQGVTLSDEEVYRRASQLLDREHGRVGPDGQLTAPAWASPEALAEVDTSGFQGWQGGQCGDYAELGREWVAELVAEIAGPDAIVNTIALERNLFANHVAVRVILPSGERLVLDVWEGLRDAAAGEVRPSISTEAEWLDRWARELRATFPGDGHIRLVTDHDDIFARLEAEYRQMYTDDTLLELQQRAVEAHRSGEAVHGTMGEAMRAELIDRGAPTARLGDERPVRQVAADSIARSGTTEQHLQQRLTIIDRVDAILAEGTIDRLVTDTGINPDAAGDRTITHLLTGYLGEAPDPTEAEARHLAILTWLQDR